MIDTFDLYNKFCSMVNTSQNGFWRPEKDFATNLNVASVLLWNNLIDKAEREQRIIDELSPFFNSQNVIVKRTNSFYGTIDKPNKKGQEYGRWGSARIIVAGNMCLPCQDVDDGKCCNGIFKSEQEITDEYYEKSCEIQVEKIDNQRWPSVLKHLTKRPTLENPKITQINNQFQVAPRSVSVVVLNYYTRPIDATFVYTLTPGNLQNGSGDAIIYNKDASTPLQWEENVENELLEILKGVYIGFTRDSQYQQISSAQKQIP